MPFISMCLTTLRWQNQCSRSLLRHCLHLIGRNRIQCEEHQHSCEIFNRFIFASFIATCLLLIPIPLPLSRAIVCSVTFGPTHQMREKKTISRRNQCEHIILHLRSFPCHPPYGIHFFPLMVPPLLLLCCSAILLCLFLKKKSFRLRSLHQRVSLAFSGWYVTESKYAFTLNEMATNSQSKPAKTMEFSICVYSSREWATHSSYGQPGWMKSITK